jgi:signal transduction histidine kinase
MATGRRGLQKASEASLDLTIVPRFYEEQWFYGICIVSAALAPWAAWQIRARHLRHQFALILAERSRVSREVHDTLLQGALGVALKVGSIEQRVSSMPIATLRERLARVRRDLEEQISEARESVAHLRSPLLEMHGLVTAIRQAAERVVRDTSIEFDLTLIGQARRLSSDVEEHLLRIAVEATTNAVRHSGGHLVLVSLNYGKDRVVLRVTDEGTGFNEEVSSEGHYGLLMMRERANCIGGALSVIHEPNGGTTLQVTVSNAA